MNLFIDTSNSYLIFSLFEDNLIDYKIIETSRNQSELFFQELDAFFNKNKISLEDITAFYFSRGPGSFTGIRIGLSFAKALLSSGYKNVYTVSSLALLFDNYENDSVIIDARSNKYYYQEVINNDFGDEKMVNIDDLNLNDCGTYTERLDKICYNIINLVKLNKYSNVIDSNYIKKAF